MGKQKPAFRQIAPAFAGNSNSYAMEPVDGQQGGLFSNPWVKYGLIAVAALAFFTIMSRRGTTSTAPAVTAVPDTNNLSTLSNLTDAVTQDYAQNQQFQQSFLSWLNNQQSPPPPGGTGGELISVDNPFSTGPNTGKVPLYNEPFASTGGIGATIAPGTQVEYMGETTQAQGLTWFKVGYMGNNYWVANPNFAGMSGGQVPVSRAG